MLRSCSFFFFFFQAEDGIRDVAVTGVQTCALPISIAGQKRDPKEGEFHVSCSGAFAYISSTAWRSAYALCGPTSALASSTGWLSGWSPAGWSRSSNGIGGDAIALPLLISRGSTAFCHRACGSVLGCGACHLCYSLKSACP